ncbi:MAG TPA: hypothetical protein VFI65_20030 [Streptosporangiaceae bacterium]|nr:hypothetical protein [Streptosporangiaceae bacterium]
MTRAFRRGRIYYLYRPSPFIDLYDDPRSRHWVVAEGQSTPPPAVAVADPVLPTA